MPKTLMIACRLSVFAADPNIRASCSTPQNQIVIIRSLKKCFEVTFP
jgi:hypothetical protein